MELAIKIAGKVDKSLGTSTKAANKQLATIQKAANKASTVMTAGLAAMGTGAIAATKYLADLGGEWQTATNQMASATGAAGCGCAGFNGCFCRDSIWLSAASNTERLSTRFFCASVSPS